MAELTAAQLAPNPGDATQQAGRARCLADARARGIPEAQIQSFLANNPYDECRLVSALMTGPGAIVAPPGSSSTPLSTISANSVATGIAVSAPALPTYSATSSPAGSSSFSGNGTGSSSPAGALVAAPGGGSSPVSLAATSTAPAVDTRLLLAAAAVVAYFVFVRG